MSPTPPDRAADPAAALIVEGVRRALLGLRGVVDEPEPVDEFDHAMQAAGHALADGADDELVVATLLHDVARSTALERAAPEPAAPGPAAPHEAVAQAWLSPRFGPRVGWLAGAHVDAKRFLVATEPGYAELLTPASAASFEDQGGPDPGGRAGHPWWPAALALRRYDDAAKRPGAPIPALDEVVAVVSRVVERHLAAAPTRPNRTPQDESGAHRSRFNSSSPA